MNKNTQKNRKYAVFLNQQIRVFDSFYSNGIDIAIN